MEGKFGLAAFDPFLHLPTVMSNTNTSLTYRKPIRLTAYIVLAITLMVIIGWLADINLQEYGFPDYQNMKFNAAAGLFLCAVLLFYFSFHKNQKHRLYSIILTLLILLIGIITCAEYVLNKSLGIDELIVFENLPDANLVLHPGRMAPLTAFCLILMGTGFLLIRHQKQIWIYVSQTCFHLATFFSFLALTGYLFNISPLYKISLFTAMAPHAAVSLLLLSVAGSLLNPYTGITGLFTGNQTGHIMARQLFPGMVITVFVLAFLRILANRYNLVSVDFGIALFGISFIVTLLFFIWRISKKLNASQSKRELAEHSLTRVSAFLNSTPDPHLIVDTNGQIIFANRQTEVVFGYIQEELIGASVELLIPARFTPHHASHIKQFFTEPKTRAMGSGMELFAVTKHNKEIPVEISLNPVMSENGLVVSASVRDISSRKATEVLIKSINDQNAVFIREAPSAIAMFDTEMRYISASNKWISDYGLTAKEIVGKSHYELFPEIGEDWKKIHRECLAGAINKCDEAYFERANGTGQWISWDIRPWYTANQSIGGIIMLTNDLTSIKEKELDKLRFEAILEKTSTISQIGAWEVNMQTGSVHWSKVLRNILEADADYAPNLESAVNMYAEGENRNRITEVLALATENGAPFDIEIEVNTLKGKSIPTRVIGQAELVNNRLVKLYGVLQSLEKIKHTEHELKQLLDLSTDQNARLKNFAQIVSHNLRSHSANFEMLLQLLMKKKPELVHSEIVHHILTGSSQLKETITNLTEIVLMSNSTSQVLINIPLRAVIEKAANSLTQLIEDSGINLINKVDERITIKAVPAYIDSILLNFITNAIKYRSHERKAFVQFSVAEAENSLILSIEDNGLGIDITKNGTKLFGMYKTFHGNPDARGLGLFMSKNQMEAMGYRIEAESTVNKGTTFNLIFHHEKI